LAIFAFVGCLNAAPAAKLDKIEKELNELKQDGAVVHKSEHVILHAVNGEKKVVDRKEETISNAKTGKKVAQISQVSQKDSDKPLKKTTEIKIPSAGIDEKTEAGKEDKEILNSVKQAEQFDEDKQKTKQQQGDEKLQILEELKQMQLAEEQRANALQNLKQMTDGLIQLEAVQRELRQFLDDIRQQRDAGNVDALLVLNEYLMYLDNEANSGRLQPALQKDITDFVNEMDTENGEGPESAVAESNEEKQTIPNQIQIEEGPRK